MSSDYVSVRVGSDKSTDRFSVRRIWTSYNTHQIFTVILELEDPIFEGRLFNKINAVTMQDL